jgi:hypothetical protein
MGGGTAGWRGGGGTTSTAGDRWAADGAGGSGFQRRGGS